MFTFILVVHAIIAALLVGVILVQKSEGGGLTTGGSPSGLMSARGAADFLTHATATLAALFVALSIVLAIMASTRQTLTIDPSLARTPPAAPAAAPPPTADAATAAALAANVTAPASNEAVPLAQ